MADVPARHVGAPGRSCPTDGTFRSERLAAAFDDPDWCAYLVIDGDPPAGFAIIRGLGAPIRVLDSFFVFRGARRSGAGSGAVRQLVTDLLPGRWEVAFQAENEAATALLAPRSRGGGTPDVDGGAKTGPASAENLCHQAIFMNHAPCAVAPLDPGLIHVCDAVG